MDSSKTEVSDRALARALGEELRRAREARNWSRTQFVTRLPSGIGDRTLVSYEQGARSMSVARLVELCRALGVTAPSTLHKALQNARLELQNLVLLVDLRRLLNDGTERFRSVFSWAHDRLEDDGDDVVELHPATVREMAVIFGCSHSDLANFLAGFGPEPAS